MTYSFAIQECDLKVVRGADNKFHTQSMTVRFKGPDGHEEVRTFEVGQGIYLDCDTMHAPNIPAGTKGKIIHLQAPMYDHDRFVMAIFEGHSIARTLKLDDFYIERVGDLPFFTESEAAEKPPATPDARPLWS